MYLNSRWQFVFIIPYYPRGPSHQYPIHSNHCKIIKESQPLSATTTASESFTIVLPFHLLTAPAKPFARRQTLTLQSFIAVSVAVSGLAEIAFEESVEVIVPSTDVAGLIIGVFLLHGGLFYGDEMGSVIDEPELCAAVGALIGEVRALQDALEAKCMTARELAYALLVLEGREAYAAELVPPLKFDSVADYSALPEPHHSLYPFRLFLQLGTSLSCRPDSTTAYHCFFGRDCLELYGSEQVKLISLLGKAGQRRLVVYLFDVTGATLLQIYHARLAQQLSPHIINSAIRIIIILKNMPSVAPHITRQLYFSAGLCQQASQSIFCITPCLQAQLAASTSTFLLQESLPRCIVSRTATMIPASISARYISSQSSMCGMLLRAQIISFFLVSSHCITASIFPFTLSKKDQSSGDTNVLFFTSFIFLGLQATARTASQTPALMSSTVLKEWVMMRYRWSMATSSDISTRNPHMLEMESEKSPMTGTFFMNSMMPRTELMPLVMMPRSILSPFWTTPSLACMQELMQPCSTQQSWRVYRQLYNSPLSQNSCSLLLQSLFMCAFLDISRMNFCCSIMYFICPSNKSHFFLSYSNSLAPQFPFSIVRLINLFKMSSLFSYERIISSFSNSLNYLLYGLDTLPPSGDFIKYAQTLNCRFMKL